MAACIIRPASLRARHCVAGRRMLYDFCATHGVAHRKCGKLIVATNDAELAKIESIAAQGGKTTSKAWTLIGGNAARALEPELSCIGALHSPETGIIDGHGFMLALRGELEDAGGMIAFNTPVTGAARERRAVAGRVSAAARRAMRASMRWSIAPGLSAQGASRAIDAYPAARVPRLVLAKGNYFSYAGRPAFSRLIYPTPMPGGLGVHVTLDLAGRMRFGPDVEWIEREDYDVDPARAEVFYARIRRYWPGLTRRHDRARLCRHPPQAHRHGRAAGGFPHRCAGAARPAGPGADVRHRVAGADLVAVAGAGSGRLSLELSRRLSSPPRAPRS